jgi:hypothetical protein
MHFESITVFILFSLGVIFINSYMFSSVVCLHFSCVSVLPVEVAVWLLCQQINDTKIN